MAEKGIRKDLLAKALSMYDPAAYRDHSVVSREAVNRPADTVTVFAFDAGEGLREQHTAPFDALVYSWKAGPRCISRRFCASGQ